MGLLGWLRFDGEAPALEVAGEGGRGEGIGAELSPQRVVAAQLFKGLGGAFQGGAVVQGVVGLPYGAGEVVTPARQPDDRCGGRRRYDSREVDGDAEPGGDGGHHGACGV